MRPFIFGLMIYLSQQSKVQHCGGWYYEKEFNRNSIYIR